MLYFVMYYCIAAVVVWRIDIYLYSNIGYNTRANVWHDTASGEKRVADGVSMDTIKKAATWR